MCVRTVQRLLGLVEQDAVEFRRGHLGEGRTYGHSCALQAAKGVNGETVEAYPFEIIFWSAWQPGMSVRCAASTA